MSVLIKYKQNTTSLKDEVIEYDIVPKPLLPGVLPDNTIAVDSVPSNFYKEWFKYYVVEGILLYNPERVSLEAAQGV